MVASYQEMETTPRGVRFPAVDEAHVWFADIDACGVGDGDLLSPDERQRAARFRFHRDRRRFVAARATLRRILASYLEEEPARLQFAYGENGKPRLAGLGQDLDLRFNLAHSETRAVYAIARGREIGVDLEVVRPMPDAVDIAEHFFSASERRSLRELLPSEIATGFFNAWTRKEAFVKAVGDGLTYPLDRFDVTLAPRAEARLLAVDGEEAAARRWTLESMRPGPEYVAAVVVEGPSSIVMRTWPHGREH